MGILRDLIFGADAPAAPLRPVGEVVGLPQSLSDSELARLLDEERRLRSEHTAIREQINVTNLATIPPVEEERLWGRSQ